MATRVLGLDIGSYSIKAALFQTTFQSFQISDLYESRPLRLDELAKEEILPAQKQALTNLFSEHDLSAERLISSISGARASARMMQLPLKDKRQIEKVLPFELEGFLPFEMSELLIDFDLSEQHKDGTSLLVFAIKRDFVAQHLQLFDGLSLTPEIIDIDVLALGNVTGISNLREETAGAILDLGHQKSSLAILKNGKVAAVRTFLTAGKQVTDALRVELDLTYQQAEEVKHKYSMVPAAGVPLKDAQQKKIAECIARVLKPLMVEVVQTLHNFETTPNSGTKVETLYLCGGTSLTRHLEPWIAGESGRKVKPLQLVVDGMQLETKIGKRQAIMLQAISLGLRSGNRRTGASGLSRVNLRKGEFALAKDYSDIRSQLSRYGLWAAILFGLALIEFAVQAWTLSSQTELVETQIIQEIAKVMPDMPKEKVRGSKQAVSLVQSRIKQYQEKVDLLTSGLKSVTALDILREISDRIPRSISVDVKEINIDRSKVFIKGDTDSFTSVDKLVSFLEKFEGFAKVEKGAIADADGSRKRFTINIVVGSAEPDRKDDKKETDKR